MYVGHIFNMRHTSNYLDICAKYNLNFQTVDGKSSKAMTLTIKVNGLSVYAKATRL